MKAFVDFIYTLLIAAGVVLFISLGIWTFYSGPSAPAYPQGPYIYKEPTAAQQQQLDQQQQQYDKDMKVYNDTKKKPYNRNVSIASLVAGGVFFGAGILLIRRSDIVGEGLSLGGAFAAVYAAVRAAIASSKPLVFISVSAVLAMIVLLAILRRRFLPPKTQIA